MEEFLKDATVTCFKDGADLLTKLNESGRAIPDLIFLDVNMPRKGGIETLSEIRSNTALNNVPVVMYSTSSQAELIERSLALGANLYLVKPDSFMELKEMLYRTMSGLPINGSRQN